MQQYMFLKKDGEIIKIGFKCNKRRLSSLKKEIIKKCSDTIIVTNREYNKNCLNELTGDHYQDVKYETMEEGNGINLQSETVKVSFTYYSYPEIVTELDRCLRGTFDWNSEFPISFKASTEPRYRRKLRQLENEMKCLENNVRVLETTSILRLVDLKNHFQNISKINISSIDVKTYYERILDCFPVTSIQIMPEVQIKEILDFMGFQDWGYDDFGILRGEIQSYDSLNPVLKQFVNKKLQASVQINSNQKKYIKAYE